MQIKSTMMAKSEKGENHAGGRRARWGKHVITSVLLLAFIVTGMMAYYARQQFWEAYFHLIHGPSR